MLEAAKKESLVNTPSPRAVVILAYPLGHAIIASYLAANHSMQVAMRTPNDDILSWWKRDLEMDEKVTRDKIHVWAQKNFHWVDPMHRTIYHIGRRAGPKTTP